MSRGTRILVVTSTFLPTVGGIQFELKWFLDNLDRRLVRQGDPELHFTYPDQASEPYARFKNIATYDLQLGRGRLKRNAMAT